MAATEPNKRQRLWLQGMASFTVLTVVAVVPATITNTPFLVFWPAFIATVLFCSALGLFWLTLWAQMKDARLGQFGIASMLFLTAFMSIFFSAVRWYALAARQIPTDRIEPGQFIVYCLIGLFLVVALSPFVLLLTDSLLWGSAYVLRWIRSRRQT